MKTLGLSIGLFLATLAPAAFAQDDASPPAAGQTAAVAAPAPAPNEPAFAAEAPKPKGPPRYDVIRLNAGVRVGYLTSRGWDTFADNDVLTQFSVDGTFPILTTKKLVLGVGAGWDGGGRSTPLRGADASITIHRLYVPIEARYNIVPGVYAFGKIAPGAAAMIASVTEPSAPATLKDTAWAFSGDASLGASVLMGPRNDMDKRNTPRFWLTPEVGYSFTTAANLALKPDRPDDQVLGSDEQVGVRSLALSGFFWRASIGVTF